MHVLIIGLPLFSERLHQELSSFDKKNKYYRLDTYYNIKDRARGLFLIRKMDAVFSINGTLAPSKLFDIALKRNIPIVMNWVGTDVINAINQFKSGDYRSEYIDQITHYCEVDWIQVELKEIGINAEIVNFVSFDKTYDPITPTSTDLTVLTYISDNRADFYGIDEVIDLAKKFPSIQFKVAGTRAEKHQPLPNNIDALGWVENMEKVFSESHVALRFPEHDGLSSFILEALARGKEVLYKYPFHHCLHCPNQTKLEEAMSEMLLKYDRGESFINQPGIDFIANNFNRNKILPELIRHLKELHNRK